MRKRRDLPVFPVTATPVRPDVDPEVLAVGMDIDGVGPEDGPRIGLITLGCDKNTVDSEKMMAALVGHGARVTSNIEGSDVIIVNTCGFIDAAKEESVETILEACQLKEEGGVKAVVAVGCMVQRYKDELTAEIPEVDLFLGLVEMGTLIPELRERGLLHDAEPRHNMAIPLRVLSTDTPHTSFLKISEGCDHTCSFCAIPSFRGLHRSAPLAELVAEAQALERQGVRELNIISQDTTWYGRELRRQDPAAPLLPDLLRALVSETSVPWYRLFYMYPSGITQEMVELIASEPQILPYLDMPLQHGSDRVLTRMRRPERQESIRQRVGWLRSAIPDLTLRTTVIVGFPGETDDDFREMLDFLEEMQFDRVGAFPYSVEDGTLAAEMPDPVPEALARERLEELMDLQRSISAERNAELVGTRVRAIVDEKIDDAEFGWVARTVGQAPDVDGVTHLYAEAVAGADADADAVAGAGHAAAIAVGTEVRVGQIITVEIEDATEYDLMARVVRDDPE